MQGSFGSLSASTATINMHFISQNNTHAIHLKKPPKNRLKINKIKKNIN
jgi:hypothetical protein